MPERLDDLVAALRDLGDRLELADRAVTPDATDPVASALRRINAGAPGTAAADVTGVDAARSAARTAEAVPASPGGMGGGARGSVDRRTTGQRLHRPRPARRLVLVAAAATLVVAAAALALPGTRTALARALGVGGVRVETTADVPAGVAAAYDLGRPLAIDRALDQAPGPLAPAAAGEPTGAFSGRPGGAMTLVWAATGRLPEIEGDGIDGIGLAVTAFAHAQGAPSITKRVGSNSTIQAVTVDGWPGYWIAGGPHVMEVLDQSGEPAHRGVRLAGNTLVWAAGDTTYRLESALDRSSAIALAETIG